LLSNLKPQKIKIIFKAVFLQKCEGFLYSWTSAVEWPRVFGLLEDWNGRVLKSSFKQGFTRIFSFFLCRGALCPWTPDDRNLHRPLYSEKCLTIYYFIPTKWNMQAAVIYKILVRISLQLFYRSPCIFKCT